MVKSISKAKIVAEVQAELRKERVKCAAKKLKELELQKQKAFRVYKNICREIDDYLEELEIDDVDRSEAD